MNITNVTVTKIAEESTENADYQLEYSIVNGVLARVHASIRKKAPDGSDDAPQTGIIYMEQGGRLLQYPRWGAPRASVPGFRRHGRGNQKK